MIFLEWKPYKSLAVAICLNSKTIFASYPIIPRGGASVRDILQSGSTILYLSSYLCFKGQVKGYFNDISSAQS